MPHSDRLPGARSEGINENDSFIFVMKSMLDNGMERLHTRLKIKNLKSSFFIFDSIFRFTADILLILVKSTGISQFVVLTAQSNTAPQ